MLQNKSLTQEIQNHARALHDYIIKFRREFHKYPETGFNEFRTSRTIAEELKLLGLLVQTNIGKTGVVGTLPINGVTSTVAFRADMDALPITKANDVEFKSQKEGRADARARH